MMNFFKAVNSQGDSMLPDYDLIWVERNPTVYRSPIDTPDNRRRIWERADKSEHRLFGNDSIPTDINTRSEESTEELWERALGDDYRSGDPREIEMIEFRVSLLEEDYQELCTDFLDAHMNPDVALIRPLIKELHVPTTKKMISSYNRICDAMDVLDKHENIDKLELLMKKAREDFSSADQYARSIGIPGIDYATKRKALKSFEIVLDDGSTKGEKLAHWSKIIKIVRESGISEDTVSSLHSHTVNLIESGDTTKLRAIS